MAKAKPQEPANEPVFDDKTIRSFGGPKSGKFRAFLSAYVGQAKLNATEAARLAGYREARKVASAFRRKYAEVLERADLAFRQSLSMGADEATERLAAIARSPTHKDHFNAVKTLLTMHGKLDPTVKVTLTRSELNQALDEVIAQLAEFKAAEEAPQGH
jgi:hypothetical protein